MKTIIVNVNLEYAFDVATDEEAEIEAKNVEFPAEYVSESFELVKIMDGNQTISGKITKSWFKDEDDLHIELDAKPL